MSGLEEAVQQGFTHVRTSAGWVPLVAWTYEKREGLILDQARLLGEPRPLNTLESLASDGESHGCARDVWELAIMKRPHGVRVSFSNYAGTGRARHMLSTWPRISEHLHKLGLSAQDTLLIEAGITGGGEFTIQALGVTIRTLK